MKAVPVCEYEYNLVKRRPETAYNVEPVREKNNKYFIFLLLCNRYSFHTIYI